MRETYLPFALPDLDHTELAEIKQALESGWITTGPKTRQFEAEFAAAVQARHAIALNSCTAAMHLALEAIDLAPGDEVITSPYTFAATAEVIRYFDARPVLVDIQPHDFNLDPALVQAAITSRTRAIVPIHIAGLPADLDALHAIARKHDLAIIQDAAHAFPASYKSRPIGGALYTPNPDPQSTNPPPSLSCFSFYATKPITTGEGGMITTDDDALAERCRVMALHGISKDAWLRYTSQGSWYYEIVAPGFKYNMTDIAAAMGLAQLRKAGRMHHRRRGIARAYTAAFSRSVVLQPPDDRPDCQHAWHLYMLRLNLHRLSIDRAAFIEQLKKRNIGCSVHFIPLHLHPYYREKYGYRPDDYPIAHREYLREISLPIFSKMTDRDVQDVIKAVLDIAEQYQREPHAPI